MAAGAAQYNPDDEPALGRVVMDSWNTAFRTTGNAIANAHEVASYQLELASVSHVHFECSHG